MAGRYDHISSQQKSAIQLQVTLANNTDNNKALTQKLESSTKELLI
jgi:hypothetical protein